MAATGSADGDDRPVYLYFTDVGEARSLAAELREHGLRTRTFASLEVMTQAASAHPPAALVVGVADARFPRLQPLKEAVRQRTGEPPRVVFVSGDDRLPARAAAVRAGGDAFFGLPVNRHGLLHLLHAPGTAGRPYRLAVLAESPDAVTAVTGTLGEGFEVATFTPGGALLPSLEAFAPELMLIDGDAVATPADDLVRVLRQHLPFSAIPMLLATAGDKRRLDGAVGEAGADGLVGLPIAPDDLEAILRGRIARHRGLRSSLGYLARRDTRTGLYNRDYFLEAVSHALAGGAAAALAYIELTDGPDDPAAHEALMVSAAEHLQRQLPPLAIAARVDTAGFGVLGSAADEAGLQSILAGGEAVTLELAGQRLSGKLGGSIASLGNAGSAGAALEAARRALHGDADEASRGTLHRHWAAKVRAALGDNRFRLVYQPISSLSGHPGALFEVFVRMLDDHGREILPAEFLQPARQAGLAPRLDRWIVGRAIHVLSQQPAGDSQPRLFVKLFPETMDDADFPAWLADTLRAEGVVPEALVLQLPAPALQTRDASAPALLELLRGIGCAVAAEHYDGTEATLLDQGLDFVKLDHRLTADILTNREHRERVQAIARQARATGVRPIACLVQDAGNLSALWQSGVEYIQGNFMQAPTEVFGEAP